MQYAIATEYKLLLESDCQHYGIFKTENEEATEYREI